MQGLLVGTPSQFYCTMASSVAFSLVTCYYISLPKEYSVGEPATAGLVHMGPNKEDVCVYLYRIQ